MTNEPQTARLRFRPVAPPDSASLLRLARDPHIRRYLLDDQLVDRAWVDAEIRRSTTLFDSHGVGLWLVFPCRPAGDTIGFGGFRVFEELDPRPQLLYALQESSTGRGLGTDLAAALVEYAVTEAGFEVIIAATDEPNVASVRVLQRLGFRRTGEAPGSFGRTLLFAYRPTSTSTSGARSPDRAPTRGRGPS